MAQVRVRRSRPLVSAGLINGEGCNIQVMAFDKDSARSNAFVNAWLGEHCSTALPTRTED